jgi:hypothetical protein
MLWSFNVLGMGMIAKKQAKNHIKSCQILTIIVTYGCVVPI